MDSAHICIHLAALDDLPMDYLITAPIRYMGGLHDNWWNPPTEARHLLRRAVSRLRPSSSPA